MDKQILRQTLNRIDELKNGGKSKDEIKKDSKFIELKGKIIGVDKLEEYLDLLIDRDNFIRNFDKEDEIFRRRIFLRGYLGLAYIYKDEEPIDIDHERMRIYLSHELNSYVEFEREDLKFSDVNIVNGLQINDIWLTAKRPRKDDARRKTGEYIPEAEMEGIELTYGGNGYELSRTKHYIDGDLLAVLNANPGGDNTFVGCDGRGGNPLTKNTVGCGPLTKNTVGCGPLTKNTVGCGPLTKNTVGCAGGGDGGWPLPTSILCEKYSTVVACDDWDFRKDYYPY